jgi:tRNA threonylcarbamoyl adenosine modification protein YjeE
MKQIFIKNQQEMIEFAKEISLEISKKNYLKTIALFGTLGVGKSFFAKHFINNLQDKKQEILSPTFNIVCSYGSKFGEIYHLDLYRLKQANELENIDFFSIVNQHITLIEWPEIAIDFLPKKYLAITIENLFDETQDCDFTNNSQRKITLEHVTKL